MGKFKDPDFFIVGLQKSGSYWVTALLNNHPEIRAFPSLRGGQTGVEEGHVFDVLATLPDDGGEKLKKSFSNHHNGFFKDIVSLIGKVSKKELHEKIRDRYREWHHKWSEGKRLVGDKTTEYIFHLDMIDEFYPHVKKICIIRDPKDRLVSWHFHQIRKGRKKEGSVTDNFVTDYVDRVIREYENMLAYKGHIHCFTYERLSREPKVVLSELLSYLGAQTSDEILERMIKEASIENLRAKDKTCVEGQSVARGAEVQTSHYRKGVVGDWQNHLSDIQARMVDEKLALLQKKVFEKYHTRS
jgi:hypothetical protein|tara:strand:+ start:39641 stop:40540 length:900 start_codon:yes stop_codon:yes gene_type:complete